MDIDTIKLSRNKGIVAFTKFCLDKKQYKDHFFCFYEGEDSKYYSSTAMKGKKFSH